MPSKSRGLLSRASTSIRPSFLSQPQTGSGHHKLGHSAKYGSYTMMDLKTNRVIDIQLVQSNEVGNSQRMEKKGFERSLSLLEERGVVQSSVTDRHTEVQKFIREQKKDIRHLFDPWHMGKGLNGCP